MKKLRQLYNEIPKIPIFGFNSGKYDMTFIVQHFTKYPIKNLITKSNSYMKLTYGNWNFINMHNFVPPDFNLNRYAPMWGVKQTQRRAVLSRVETWQQTQRRAV